MDSKVRKAQAKARLKEMGIDGRKKTVTLTCNKCGKNEVVNTNDPKIYTPEVRAKHVCWNCQHGVKPKPGVVKPIKAGNAPKKNTDGVSKADLIVQELIQGGKSPEEIAERVAKKCPNAKLNLVINQVKGVMRHIKMGVIPRWAQYELVKDKVQIKEK